MLATPIRIDAVREADVGLSFFARMLRDASSKICNSATGGSSRYSTSDDSHGFGGLEIGRSGMP